jgi:regulator of RNase E activity RraA
MRRAQGIVIDGACRDLDESLALNLPIYGRAAVPVTARGRIIEYTWNEPVIIDGVPVSPNDLIIADASGVAVIPAQNAIQVIEVAEKIVAREKAMADAVRAGKPVSEVMGAGYETMLG